MVLVMGEISTSCYVDIPAIVRKTVCDIGYDKPEYGFDGSTCAVLTSIDEQSGDMPSAWTARWRRRRARRTRGTPAPAIRA